jgi:hypothetical protein
MLFKHRKQAVYPPESVSKFLAIELARKLCQKYV